MCAGIRMTSVMCAAATAAVALQPRLSLSLLNSFPPGFSLSLALVFEAHVSHNATASSLTPSSHLFPGFSYSSVAVNCLLQGFFWYATFHHSDYVPCPLQSSKFDECCDVYIFI